MAKRRQYQEKGIREDVDYGTQFLNARGSEASEAAPSAPTPPPADPDGPPAERRSVGFVLMVLLAIGAVIAGIVGFVVLGGDSGAGEDGDLITAGAGINVNERGVPEGPTTTTAPVTTTAAPTTVPTTAVSTTPPSTVPPDTLLPPPPPPPPTTPPTTRVSCPGGSTRTVIDPGFPVVSPGGRFTLEITGTTTNSTSAAFDLTMAVNVSYEQPAGHARTTEVRPDQYGRSIPPGGSLAWTATVTVQAAARPQPVGVTGTWTWSDARYAECATGSFGG